MKKLLCLLLTGAMAMSMLAACGGNGGSGSGTQQPPAGGSGTQQPPASGSGTQQPGGSTGKVAIVTNTVSQNEEEYRSAEEMSKKYGDRIVHVT